MTKAGIKYIAEIIEYAQATQPIYPSRSDTLKLLGEVLRGSDYDGNTRSGISDPTPAQAFQLKPWHDKADRISAHLIEARNHMKLAYQEIVSVPSDMDTKALVRQHQCRGGASSVVDVEGWEIAGLCEALADTRDGLCYRCYQRRWKWSREHPRIEGAA